ncbi:hypothetical protein [Lentilitoribacter sp. Alg239-R112]|uniref:hypothetical protein n=1 Tax=Lentilitoribacter sp. Alg239-R112 TaxID=2305987 RepID=UPI0013A6FB19|nr:hypothetical protein [Lentilitoribacter sp. Alg239-R112]
MMKKISALLVYAICVELVLSQQVSACACCADPGYREQGLLPVSAYEFSVLSALELDGPGNLYMTACAEDCVSGLDWFQSTVETDFSVNGDLISIVLNHDTSERTVLEAKLPNEIFYLAKDLNPGDTSTSVWLKTEFLMALNIYGSGPGWSGGSDTIPTKLIFYGGGNACPDIALTNYWLLDVGGSGQSARFRLFGKLFNSR